LSGEWQITARELIPGVHPDDGSGEIALLSPQWAMPADRSAR